MIPRPEKPVTICCHKTSLRSSAAQWNLDALVSFDGIERIPCHFSVVPTWCTFQTVSSGEGEELVREVTKVFGPPASLPQVVKGGSCGGEEEDAEIPFAGAMLSVTWEFPREERGEFLDRIQTLFDGCPGTPR